MKSEPKWVATPFQTLTDAREWAASADALIEPFKAPGFRAFKVIDEDTETIVAQPEAGGPVMSLTHERKQRVAPPMTDRVLQYGEDPPWIWSPSLSSLAAVEKLFNEKVCMHGDYIAYRKDHFLHEYVIDHEDNVWQRILICKA